MNKKIKKKRKMLRKKINSMSETEYLESIPGLVDSILEARKEMFDPDNPEENSIYDPNKPW